MRIPDVARPFHSQFQTFYEVLSNSDLFKHSRYEIITCEIQTPSLLDPVGVFYKALLATDDVKGIWRRKAEARVVSSVTLVLLFCRRKTY